MYGYIYRDELCYENVCYFSSTIIVRFDGFNFGNVAQFITRSNFIQ